MVGGFIEFFHFFGVELNSLVGQTGFHQAMKVIDHKRFAVTVFFSRHVDEFVDFQVAFMDEFDRKIADEVIEIFEKGGNDALGGHEGGEKI